MEHTIRTLLLDGVPDEGEVLKLMLSKEGQQDVVKDGYYPIPGAIAREELNKVQ